MPNNDRSESVEERFRKIGEGSVRFIALRDKLLTFIKNEKELSYKEGRESMSDYKSLTESTVAAFKEQMREKALARKHKNVVIGGSASVARDTLLQGENQGIDKVLQILDGE